MCLVNECGKSLLVVFYQTKSKLIVWLGEKDAGLKWWLNGWESHMTLHILPKELLLVLQGFCVHQGADTLNLGLLRTHATPSCHPPFPIHNSSSCTIFLKATLWPHAHSPPGHPGLKIMLPNLHPLMPTSLIFLHKGHITPLPPVALSYLRNNRPIAATPTS